MASGYKNQRLMAESRDMKKIASPNELTQELRSLLAYSKTKNPSREKLAHDLSQLAQRVETTASGAQIGGVSKGTRQGTRVRFTANPGSLVLYTHHPEIGEEGTVGTMPGFGKRTYLPGPGGGLLYVNWDQSGLIGVSPNDVDKA